jgi:hypothetical protein
LLSITEASSADHNTDQGAPDADRYAPDEDAPNPKEKAS